MERLREGALYSLENVLNTVLVPRGHLVLLNSLNVFL